MRKARIRRRWAATVDLVESSQVAHATVGELSQPAATWACARSATCSRMSQWHNKPAISRSELVSVPVGLSSDTRRHCISGGKGSRQTIGGRYRVPPNHTPPAPCLDASQYVGLGKIYRVGESNPTATQLTQSILSSSHGTTGPTRTISTHTIDTSGTHQYRT